MSDKLKLNKTDALKILKGAGIAAGASALTYILNLLPNIDFGEYAIVIIPIASTLINAILKLLKEN